MGIGELRRAVFLDRDGVLNRVTLRNGRPLPPANLDALEIPPEVPGVLTKLASVGFRLIVVTNQPDVARGRQSRAIVEQINAALAAALPLNEFRVCYHDGGDRCTCRKPAPGLLLAAARDYNLDMGSCYMVGDRWRDVEAAQRAGCRALFIDYSYNERRPRPPFVVVGSLSQAAELILQEAHGRDK